VKIAQNVTPIEKEIGEDKFEMNLSDHILYLKSFISKDKCLELVDKLTGDSDKSSPYTEGLLNDHTDSYFDPSIDVIKEIQDKVSTEGLKLYSEKVRAFNWAYYGIEKFHCSEMVVRRYHPGSEFEYHYDDIIEEIFPHWFVRRKNILTCNVYMNENTEYTGGDLHLASCNKTYRPSIGDIMIFPSNWMFYHKVKEVTSGVRYSGTFWYYYGSDKRVGKGQSHKDKFLKS
jgi:hypothetical protein